MKHKIVFHGKTLFNKLTEQTFNIVKKSEIPYFHFSEEEQVGSTFGQRFTHAIKSIFNKGFDQVITIGNDTPLLTTSLLLEANKQLNNQKLVLGTSKDGGFYLMGLHKDQFNATAFNTLSWQTSSLSKQLRNLILGYGNEIFQLPTLSDIDTIKDIENIVSYSKQLPRILMSLFLQIIGLTKSYLNQVILVFEEYQSNISHNRGSPKVLSI